MDRQIDELEEIRLKVVDDADCASSTPAPAAAAEESTCTSMDSGTGLASQPTDVVTASDVSTATGANPSPPDDFRVSAPGLAGDKHPTAPAERGGGSNSRTQRFSKSTGRKAFLILFLVALVVAADNGLKSFWNSPVSSQLVVFLGPSIYSAWCGDPDTANALQAMPVMAIDVSTTGAGREAFPAQRRAALVASLERFVGSVPVEKRTMSSLVDSVVLAADGKPGPASVLLQDLDSSSPVVCGFHAAVLTMIGQYSEALKKCDRGINAVMANVGGFSSSSYEALWIVKAQILIAMGRPDEALKVLELPGYPELYKESALKHDNLLEARAAAYLRLKQPDKAIITACQMPQLNHIILSTAYLMKGDIEQAQHHAGKSYLALSRIYSQTGRLEEALAYAKLADQANLGVAGREQHVFVLNQMGRFRDALALCTDLSALPKMPYMIESIQNLPELHADAAWAHAKLGEIKQAREHANWALQVDPTCRQALEAARLASQLAGDAAGYHAYDSRLKNLNPILYDRPVLFTNKNNRY